MTEDDDGFAAVDERLAGEPKLVVDVGGFEGPLDLLLDLARRQKVDLREISILALAEQYLAFVEEARRVRLELAADYLVMAAWLAFLKSRLLLPEPPRPDAAPPADLGAVLLERLRRLDAIRAAARFLAERPQLGRDLFARGAPDDMPAAPAAGRPLKATLKDLLASYGRQRSRLRAPTLVTIARRPVWTLADARALLERLVGEVGAGDWLQLDSALLRFMMPGQRATIIASTLSAALELVREERAEISQEAPFAPLWMRGRRGSEPAGQGAAA